MFLEKQYRHDEKVMESLDLKHKIKVSIRDKIGWFEIIEFNYNCQKTFIILLKDVIDHYKNGDVEIIKQYVVQEDKDYFSNSIVSQIDDNLYEVVSQIDKFIDDMVSVLGILRL